MKTTVLAFVLVAALAAGAQDATPQQTQPAAPAAPAAAGQQPSGQPPAGRAREIKDPAEYNAYLGAYQQKDSNAKISALEAFLTQYPNSVMKTTALELLMATYQQSGNQAKVVEAAKRLLTADPCNFACARSAHLSCAAGCLFGTEPAAEPGRPDAIFWQGPRMLTKRAETRDYFRRRL